MQGPSIDVLLGLDEGTRLYLLAPIVRGRKGEYRKEPSELNRKGFSRVRINGDVYDIDDTPDLDNALAGAHEHFI